MSLIGWWNQQTNIIASQVNSEKITNSQNNKITNNNSTNSQNLTGSSNWKKEDIDNKSSENSPTNPQIPNQNNQSIKSDKSVKSAKSAPVYPNTKWQTFTILAPKNLVSNIAWRFFQINFKKNSWWIVKFKFYDNPIEYDKDLTYKLATKDDSFDFAIVPAYWFNHLNKVTNISFKIPNLNFSLGSLFDYNFSSFLENNTIKAIPFAIDPIVGYAYGSTKLNPIQDFESWKNLIINNPNRLTPNWKIKVMPIFLGYDNNYLNYIQKNKYSLFPVFDFILHYYFFKKSEKWAKLIKDFWFSLIYKTFNFRLFQRYAIRYKKYDFCKNNLKYCLLFDKKTNLVYWLASDERYLRKNRLEIFKKFKIRTTQIQKVSVPLANMQAEYPAKWRIIIINPNSKNLKNLWKFIQTYLLLGQNNLLPFYKNMISPFVKTQQTPKNLEFLSSYLGRFLILYNMQLDYPRTLNQKEFNYLKWNIGF